MSTLSRAEIETLSRPVAADTGIPVSILLAVAWVESSWNTDAVGSRGEYGLMQVLPSTARDMGFSGDPSELLDAALSLEVGAKYIAYQLRRWRTMERALSAYNAGHPTAGNMDSYVRPILALAARFERGEPTPEPALAAVPWAVVAVLALVVFAVGVKT